MVGRILIVDDVATNRIVLKVKLGAACYRPMLAADGAGCLAIARAEAPDLILLDLKLPDMSGIEVLRHLREDPTTRDIPVIMISAMSDPASRLAALAAGADEFMAKPYDDLLLMARMRSLLRARELPADVGPRGAALQALGLAEAAEPFERPGLIGIVAERADPTAKWRRDLAPLLPDRVVILSREEALEESGPAPDVFLITSRIGDAGLRLMSDLRSRPETRHAAICIVQTDASTERAAIAFDLGADDLVGASVDPRELRLRLRNLMRRKQRGDRQRETVQTGLRLAIIDPLTGLYNRRYAAAHLAAMAERAQESGHPFAVMVIDLDRFKMVNDRWGHAAGDAVLIEVARRLEKNLRQGDLLARIGGEEFLVALTDTRLSDARTAAERLCQAVQERPIPLPGGEPLSITVSIGLAVDDAGAVGLEPVAAVVNRADLALMASKNAGRNQVTISRTAA